MDAAHDWVVTHTLKASTLGKGGGDPLTFLDRVEKRKVNYADVRCRENVLDFLPLAVDTFGGFGEVASHAIDHLANELRLFRGKDAGPARQKIIQRLQVTLFRGVAYQILRRAPNDALRTCSEGSDGGVDELAASTDAPSICDSEPRLSALLPLPHSSLPGRLRPGLPPPRKFSPGRFFLFCLLN